MLWNGGMIGLGFASLDNAVVVPALAWLGIGSAVAWVLEEATGFWKSTLGD